MRLIPFFSARPFDRVEPGTQDKPGPRAADMPMSQPNRSGDPRSPSFNRLTLRAREMFPGGRLAQRPSAMAAALSNAVALLTHS